MLFEGRLKGKLKSTVLTDIGATHNFTDETFARKRGIDILPRQLLLLAPGIGKLPCLGKLFYDLTCSRSIELRILRDGFGADLAAISCC